MIKYTLKELKMMSIEELQTLNAEVAKGLKKTQQLINDLGDAGWDVEHSEMQEQVTEAQEADPYYDMRNRLISSIMAGQNVLERNYNALDIITDNQKKIRSFRDQGFTSINPSNFYAFIKLLDFLGSLNYRYDFDEVKELYEANDGDAKSVIDILKAEFDL